MSLDLLDLLDLLNCLNPLERDSLIRARKRQVAWQVYSRTAKIPSDSYAYLHSFQAEEDCANAIKRTAPGGKAPDDAKYRPGSDKRHDMRVNNAWLLGLAHRKIPALLTTSLTDQTIIRQSAKQAPKFRTTDHNLSALAREVIGMTQKGHYTVSNSPAGQVLNPTLTAVRAKLTDFNTPKGIPKEELKLYLDKIGIDTSGIHLPRPYQDPGQLGQFSTPS